MSKPENLKHSRRPARLFDAVSRASGDGVRWILQVSGAVFVDEAPEITLVRTANGATTHIFSDRLYAKGIRNVKVVYDTVDRGRILMRKDMALRRSRVQKRAAGNANRDKIMLCIHEYIDRIGRAPSHTEISEATGVSRQNVGYHLKVLQQEGKIEILHGRQYGIILKEDDHHEHE